VKNLYSRLSTTEASIKQSIMDLHRELALTAKQRQEAQHAASDGRFRVLEQKYQDLEKRWQSTEALHEAMQRSSDAQPQRRDALEELASIVEERRQLSDNRYQQLEERYVNMAGRLQEAETVHESMHQWQKAMEGYEKNADEQQQQAKQMEKLLQELQVAATEENKILEARHKTVEESLQTLEERFHELKHCYQDAETNQDSSTKWQKAMDDAYQELRDRQRDLEREKAELERSLTSAAEHREKVMLDKQRVFEEQQQDLVARSEACHEILMQLQQAIENTQRSVQDRQAMKEAQTELQRELSAVTQEQHQATQVRTDAMEQRYNQLAECLDGHQRTVDGWQKAVDEALTDLQTQQQAAAQMMATVAEEQQMVSDKTLTATTEHYQGLVDRYQTLEQRWNETETRLASIQEWRSTLENQYQELQEQQRQLHEQQKAELQQTIAGEAEERCRRLQQNYEVVEERCRETEQRYQELEKRWNALQEQCVDNQTKLQETQGWQKEMELTQQRQKLEQQQEWELTHAERHKATDQIHTAISERCQVLDDRCEHIEKTLEQRWTATETKHALMQEWRSTLENQYQELQEQQRQLHEQQKAELQQTIAGEAEERCRRLQQNYDQRYQELEERWNALQEQCADNQTKLGETQGWQKEMELIQQRQKSELQQEWELIHEDRRKATDQIHTAISERCQVLDDRCEHIEKMAAAEQVEFLALKNHVEEAHEQQKANEIRLSAELHQELARVTEEKERNAEARHTALVGSCQVLQDGYRELEERCQDAEAKCASLQEWQRSAKDAYLNWQEQQKAGHQKELALAAEERAKELDTILKNIDIKYQALILRYKELEEQWKANSTEALEMQKVAAENHDEMQRQQDSREAELRAAFAAAIQEEHTVMEERHQAAEERYQTLQERYQEGTAQIHAMIADRCQVLDEKCKAMEQKSVAEQELMQTWKNNMESAHQDLQEQMTLKEAQQRAGLQKELLMAVEDLKKEVEARQKVGEEMNQTLIQRCQELSTQLENNHAGIQAALRQLHEQHQAKEAQQQADLQQDLAVAAEARQKAIAEVYQVVEERYAVLQGFHHELQEQLLVQETKLQQGLAKQNQEQEVRSARENESMQLWQKIMEDKHRDTHKQGKRTREKLEAEMERLQRDIERQQQQQQQEMQIQLQGQLQEQIEDRQRVNERKHRELEDRWIQTEAKHEVTQGCQRELEERLQTLEGEVQGLNPLCALVPSLRERIEAVRVENEDARKHLAESVNANLQSSDKFHQEHQRTLGARLAATEVALGAVQAEQQTLKDRFERLKAQVQALGAELQAQHQAAFQDFKEEWYKPLQVELSGKLDNLEAVVGTSHEAVLMRCQRLEQVQEQITDKGLRTLKGHVEVLQHSLAMVDSRAQETEVIVLTKLQPAATHLVQHVASLEVVTEKLQSDVAALNDHLTDHKVAVQEDLTALQGIIDRQDLAMEQLKQKMDTDLQTHRTEEQSARNLLQQQQGQSLQQHSETVATRLQEIHLVVDDIRSSTALSHTKLHQEMESMLAERLRVIGAHLQTVEDTVDGLQDECRHCQKMNVALREWVQDMQTRVVQHSELEDRCNKMDTSCRQLRHDLYKAETNLNHKLALSVEASGQEVLQLRQQLAKQLSIPLSLLGGQ